MVLIDFVIGAVLGSAAGALAYRLPKKISWIGGRSRCESCGHALGFWDLVPVWSYLKLRGKCRYCHSPIGLRNWWVEVVMGLGFVFLPGVWLKAIFWVTVIIFLMDLETKLVSEALVLVWGVIVVISGGVSLWGVLAGVGLIGGLWAVTQGKGMGFGDVEIAAVMGLWLGWPRILVALWVAFVVGGVVGSWQLAVGKKRLKSEIAFGPFLLAGAWVGLLWGDVILRRVLPYGF